MKDAQLAAFLRTAFAIKGSIPGRKAFQKLLYLAQVGGWPSDFSYRLHLFGPYSDEAANQLEILEEGGAVIETPAGEIRPGAYLDTLAAAAEVPGEAEQSLQAMLAEFGQNTPLELELLATALFMWQADKRVQTHATDEGVANRVRHYKGDKFTLDEVHQSIARLKEFGLATD